MTTLFDLNNDLKEGDFLDLLSTYKGLPLVCATKVIGFRNKRLTLLSRNAAMLAILRNKTACALGHGSRPPFQCHLTRADLLSGVMEFDAYPLEASLLGERRSPRVEPKEVLPLDIEVQGTHFPATLVDISLEGMGISLLDEFFTFALKPGALIEAHLCLSETELDLSGRIVAVTHAQEYNRISIHFTYPYKNARALLGYLHQRRQEIQHELLDEYQAALLWGELLPP